MNKEFNLYRKLYKEFLPLWAERVGYIDGFLGYEYIFPENISKIPIQFAPTSSLDGLFIDLEHSPKTLQNLTSYIQTVSPGGIVLAHLKKEFWNKKNIQNTFKTSGFELFYLSLVPDYNTSKIENFLKNKGFLYNFFLETYPLTIWSFKRHWFLIAKKNLLLQKSSDFIQFSVVLPIQTLENLKKISLWEEFFSKRNVYNSELIIINNLQRNLEIPKNQFVQIRIIQHYIPTDSIDCIYTGLYHSRGKIILVDSSTENFKPEIFFELIDQYLKSVDPTKPFAIYAYPRSNKRKYLKNVMNQIFYGISHSESCYRMYNLKSIEIFFRFHPFILRKNPYLIEKEIKKNKGKILQIPYVFDYPSLKKKL